MASSIERQQAGDGLRFFARVTRAGQRERLIPLGRDGFQGVPWRHA